MAGTLNNNDIFISEILDDLICDTKTPEFQSRFTFFIMQDVYKNYDIITQHIYRMNAEDLNKLKIFFEDKKNKDSSPFGKFVQELVQVELMVYEVDTMEKLGGFERNINLSILQREFILGNVKQANEEAEKAKEIAESAGEIKTKIYSEFLGILAIFTALTFSMMGSIQLLGNVFNDVKALDNKGLGFAMIVSSIYLLVIYMLIIVMFVGVKKIIGNGNDYDFNPEVKKLVFGIVAVLFIIGLIFKAV